MAARKTTKPLLKKRVCHGCEKRFLSAKPAALCPICKAKQDRERAKNKQIREAKARRVAEAKAKYGH